MRIRSSIFAVNDVVITSRHPTFLDVIGTRGHLVSTLSVIYGKRKEYRETQGNESAHNAGHCTGACNVRISAGSFIVRDFMDDARYKRGVSELT